MDRKKEYKDLKEDLERLERSQSVYLITRDFRMDPGYTDRIKYIKKQIKKFEYKYCHKLLWSI